MRAVYLGFFTIIFNIEASSAATSDYFDLYCRPVEVGMEVNGEYKKSSYVPEQPSVRMSVHLGQKVWCYQPCRIRGDVKETDLELRMSGGPPGIGVTDMLVSRDSGMMVSATRLKSSIRWMTTYECAKKPYTAMPAKKF
ncbi:hypothetical protein [Sphingobium sp. Z007]|uniref:hypothetical protein n=1 Tax=Sphingobium sp. Z007 TaxID=627495 RepID=UPI001124D0DC|nr:hypothetical protein [Sphingobium sp. Z007]